MRSHPSILVLIILGAFGVSISAYGQGSEGQEYDPARIRQALNRWRTSRWQYDTTRPTLLFTTSLGQCAGCCAAAINSAISRIGERNAGVNYAVVIAASTPKEGLVLRKLFTTTKNVAEDIDTVLASVFGWERAYPDLYVVGAAGNVIARYRNIQQHPVDVETLMRDLVGRPGNEHAMPAPGIKVAKMFEDDETGISDITSPVLRPGLGLISFVETHQNAIFSYEIETGKLAEVITPSDSLGLYYSRFDPDTAAWRTLARHYPTLVNYLALVRSPSDTLRVIAQLMGEHWRFKDKDGRTNTGWRGAPNIVSMLGDRVLSVDRLRIGRYLVQDPVLALGGNDLLGTGFWRGYENPEGPRDSLFHLVEVTDNYAHVHPTLATRSLDSIYGRPLDPTFATHMVLTRNETLFLIDEGNGTFIKCRKEGEMLACDTIAAGGMLREVVGRTRNPGSGIKVGGLVTDGRVVFVLLADRRTPNDHTLVLQSYSEDGKFIGESVVYRKDDEAVVVRAVGMYKGKVVGVVKWGRERWEIVRVAAE